MLNVKLNPNKTNPCSREITWCGRKISEAGIRFDDSCMQVLLQLPEPTRADQLQKFFCASNWIRTKINRYAEAVSLLQESLKYLHLALIFTALFRFSTARSLVSLRILVSIQVVLHRVEGM